MKKLLFLGLFFVGCVTNGGPVHRLECIDSVLLCHKEARELCPRGYLVTNRVRPRPMEDVTIFYVNIRCRQGGSLYN